MLPECDSYAAASRSDIQYLDLLICIVEDDLLDQFFGFRARYQDGRGHFELKAVEIGSPYYVLDRLHLLQTFDYVMNPAFFAFWQFFVLTK